MLDLLLRYAADPSLSRELAAAIADLRASAGQGDASLVGAAEEHVRASKPGDAFDSDADGFATLAVGGHAWAAGRFTTPTIAELRERARSASPGNGRIRLWVFDGVAAATDVGGLQATAPPGTLFQAASQFNCLESPGPYVTPVVQYFRDSTQGPRASISAFPGTLLRHYAAPDARGKRFVQTDARQLNLLADALPPDVARVEGGYLTAFGVRSPAALVEALEANFESIRVGLHEGVQVVLGYDFEGGVEDSETRRISQVFTSTVAGGGYGGTDLGEPSFTLACGHLLRAAYLGTLLAAATTGQRRVVLTLIGGGVFGNPIPLIWATILRAIEEAEPLLSADLDVVVNGRNLGRGVSREAVAAATRARGGALLSFGRDGLVVVSG